MTDLKDLKELANSATPGPWAAREMTDHTPGKRMFWFEVGKWPDMVAHIQAHNSDDQNAAFIAAANPKTVLELIARVEAAEGSNSGLIEATSSLNAEQVLRIKDLEATGDAKDAAIVAGANTIHELRTALEQAKAREVELRSALTPFANQSQHYDGIKGDSVRTAIQVQLGWLRNAVTALGGDDA